MLKNISFIAVLVLLVMAYCYSAYAQMPSDGDACPTGANAGTAMYGDIGSGEIAALLCDNDAASSGVYRQWFSKTGSGALNLKSYGSGTFTGTAAKYLAVDSAGKLIETDGTGGGGGSLPTGMIVLWSGSIASIPSGWALCDGTGGTPDLRDRFVVGAGSTYAVNDTGGSADAVVVDHDHSLTDPGHTHNFRSSQYGGSVDAGTRGDAAYGYAGVTNSKTTGITIDSKGVSGTDANLPPYFSLAYIIKL